MKTIAAPLATSLAVCMLAAGCGSSAPKPPPQPEAQPGKPKRAAQGWIAAHRDWTTDRDLAAILAQPENRQARVLLASPQCSEPAPRSAGKAGGTGAPFLVAASRDVFGLAESGGRANAGAVQREGLDTSSVDIGFSALGFRGIRCAVYARYAVGDAPSRPGLLAVLGIEQRFEDGKYTDFFRFRPLHVRAGNTIARTTGGAPKIAVSFAVVARQLVVNSAGAATFAELGAATVSVPGVPVGGDGIACGPASCAGMSAPIPVPVARGTVVLAIGVSEAGETGADVDQSAAEQAALKAALGPAAPVLPAHPGRRPEK
ncbi:hypothetical protein [Cupriavidus agavae]|uniref:hypothetical protein n=1 Tax=Cupriavidus agavae TaxID=1001822 RepID=UPI00102B0E8D|nr:hypothetical protein [Cupriavidus agavae]